MHKRIIMQFSGKELSALIKMAFSMASADGKFVDEEKAAITLGMAEFGLGRDQILACVTIAEKMSASEAFEPGHRKTSAPRNIVGNA